MKLLQKIIVSLLIVAIATPSSLNPIILGDDFGEVSTIEKIDVPETPDISLPYETHEFSFEEQIEKSRTLDYPEVLNSVRAISSDIESYKLEVQKSVDYLPLVTSKEIYWKLIIKPSTERRNLYLTIPNTLEMGSLISKNGKQVLELDKSSSGNGTTKIIASHISEQTESEESVTSNFVNNQAVITQVSEWTDLAAEKAEQRIYRIDLSPTNTKQELHFTTIFTNESHKDKFYAYVTPEREVNSAQTKSLVEIEVASRETTTYPTMVDWAEYSHATQAKVELYEVATGRVVESVDISSGTTNVEFVDVPKFDFANVPIEYAVRVTPIEEENLASNPIDEGTDKESDSDTDNNLESIEVTEVVPDNPPYSVTYENTDNILFSGSIFRSVLRSATPLGTINLTLKEYSNGTTTNTVIAGAKFEIRKLGSDIVVREPVTGQNGQIQVSGLDLGSYTITQKTTPDAYRLPKNTIQVDLTAAKTTVNVVAANVKKNTITTPATTNQPTDTTLRLKAVSSVDGMTPIAGATFLIKGNNGYRNTVTTDATGSVNVPNLLAGDYEVVQVSTPEHFMVAAAVQKFTIPAPELQPPDAEKFAQFVDLKFRNQPYDASRAGTLTINVFEGKNNKPVTPNVRIPNVTIKVTDDLGRVYIGSTDSNGKIIFKGLSRDRTYKAEIIDIPYEYDDEFKFVENIRLNIQNYDEKTMYLPRKAVNAVTFINHETGSFDTKISGSKFKLTHPDGTSREFTISSSDGTLAINLPLGNYELEQLTTDVNHRINPNKISFKVGTPALVPIPNDLIGFEQQRVSVNVTKIWGDTPGTAQTRVIKLFRNGIDTGKSISVSSTEGRVTKSFQNLEKYDSDHIAYTYSVKENIAEGWFADYKEVSKNNWEVTNYEGVITSGNRLTQQDRPLVWVSSENKIVLLENGTMLRKTITLPETENSKWGSGIGYDRQRGYLYAGNRNGKLVVVDPTIGDNGKVIKTVTLGELAERITNYFPVSGGGNSDFKKLNSLETSPDGKYIIAKSLADPNIYFYRTEDLLSSKVSDGGRITPARVVDSRQPVLDSSYSGMSPVSDGDFVIFDNGDILYSGHQNKFYAGSLSAPIRDRYKFFILKYTGQLDAQGRAIDIGTGSYSAAEPVGHLRSPASANIFRDGTTSNTDSSIDGLTLVNGRLFITSNIEHSPGNTTKSIMAIYPNGMSADSSNWTTPDRNTHPNRAFEVINLKDVAPANPGIDQAFSAAETLDDMTGASREVYSATVTIKGKKVWIGDTATDRPASIQVQLFVDGQPYKVNNQNVFATLNSENDWTYNFTGLPKFKQGTIQYKYTVKEVTVPQGYTVTYDGTSIINEKTFLPSNGNLKIKKVNGIMPLAGARFTLYAENKVDVVQASAESGSDGVITFNRLNPGVYYLKETQAPEDYVLSETLYRVVGTYNQQTKTIDFVVYESETGTRPLSKNGEMYLINNVQSSFKIKVVKIDEQTGEKITGSRFAITNKDGVTINGQVATLSSGEFVFSNSNNSKFKPGTYYLKEEAAPSRYIKHEALIPFTISADGSVTLNNSDTGIVDAYGTSVTQIADTIELRVRNRKSELLVHKVDQTGNLITSGQATFELYRGSNKVATKQTDQGVTKFTDLTQGSYTLRETIAPQGYARLSQDYTVIVSEAGKVSVLKGNETVDSQPLKVTNEKLYTLNLKKIILGTNTSLAGARFKIKAENVQTRIPVISAQLPLAKQAQFNVVASLSESSLTWTTHSVDDFMVDVVPGGLYRIEEITPPNGFTALSPFTVQINQDGTAQVVNDPNTGLVHVATVANNSIGIGMSNRRSVAKFTLSKRIKGIETTGTHGISDNLTFTLTKDNDSSFTPKELTKRFNENFVFENLSRGLYTLTETSPPNGYVRTGEVYKVEVDENGNLNFYKFDPKVAAADITTASVIKSSNLSLYRTGPNENSMLNRENTFTTYSIANPKENTFVGLDLGSVVKLNNITLNQATNRNINPERFTNGILEYSQDGVNYIVIKEINAPNNYNNTIDVSHQNIYARYVRLKATSAADAGNHITFRTFVVNGISGNKTSLTPEQQYGSAVDSNIILLGNLQHPKMDLRKINSQNSSQVQGTAVFKLYKVDNTVTSIEKTSLANQTHIQEFTVTDGALNEVVQLAQDLGRYALVETQAPNGYQLLEAPILLDLVETQQVHDASNNQNKGTTKWQIVGDNPKITIDETNLGQNKITIRITNDPVPTGRFKIKKVDKNGKSLGRNYADRQAQFKLWLASDENISYTRNADNTGFADFSNIPVGEYKLKEIKVPFGFDEVEYILSPDVYDVRIDSSGVVTISLNGEVINLKNDSQGVPYFEFINYSDFPVSILKVSEDETTRLSGATFTLTSVNGDNPIDVETGSDGLATFNVKPGIYILKEKIAPLGHVPITTEYRIEVDDSGQITLTASDDFVTRETIQIDGKDIIVIKIKNRKTSYPNTGGFGSRNWYYTGTSIMLLAIFIYIFRRRKAEDY